MPARSAVPGHGRPWPRAAGQLTAEHPPAGQLPAEHPPAGQPPASQLQPGQAAAPRDPAAQRPGARAGSWPTARPARRPPSTGSGWPGPAHPPPGRASARCPPGAAPGHVPALADELAAHRVDVRGEAGQPLQRDAVLGRAGPVHLPVRQPPQQVPGGQFVDGGVDLGRAHVVAARQGGQPGQPPPGLMVDQGRRHAVGEDTGGDAVPAPGTRPADVVCPVGRHSA